MVLSFSSAQLTVQGVGELRCLLQNGLSRSPYTRRFPPILRTSTSTCGKRAITDGRRALGRLLKNLWNQEAKDHHSINASASSFLLFSSTQPHGRPISIPVRGHLQAQIADFCVVLCLHLRGPSAVFTSTIILGGLEGDCFLSYKGQQTLGLQSRVMIISSCSRNIHENFHELSDSVRI